MGARAALQAEYVRVELPTAETEFGRLGGALGGAEDASAYQVVRVDSERVQCKAAALDAYVSLWEARAARAALAPAQLEQLASCVVALCQHSSAVLRLHAVRLPRGADA